MCAPVIWITGLAGAGKTTVAREVHSQLKLDFVRLAHLDGDVIREVCGSDLGYELRDRIANAFRISRFSKMLADQDIPVLCSTVSLFPQIWEWNREHISNYLQVYLKVSKETVRSRDQKQLYSGSACGQVQGVVGEDQPFIEPTCNDLVLQNEQPAQFAHNVTAIVQLVRTRISVSACPS